MKIYVLDLETETFTQQGHRYPSRMAKKLLWYAMQESSCETKETDIHYLGREGETAVSVIDLKVSDVADSPDWNSYEELGKALHRPIMVGEKGKPFFSDGPFFSLTHSGRWVGLVLAAQPVGMDLETGKRVKNPETMTDRFFAEHEKAALRQISLEERRDLFLKLWCRKEAYGKMRGEGLSPTVLQMDMVAPEMESFFAEMMWADEYRMCICLERTQADV